MLKEQASLEEGRDRRMSVLILLLAIYIIAAAGIVVMKKIQPEDKVYSVWVVFVCIVVTCFLVWYVS